MPPLPHVRALKIRNFKGIAKLDLPLDHSLTLLAGINGVGKTSAIEALLGAVTGMWSWLGPDGTEAWFRPSGDLVRYGTREGNITMELALASDVRTTFTIPFQEALIVEQTGQCVYFGRGVDLELRNGHHIEHFRPRSRYPHYELTYRNLF